MALWRAYIRTYDRHGNDPYIGRRLVSLLHKAGVRPVRTASIFFGGCSGSETFDDLVENLAMILEGARASIISAGFVDAELCDAAVAALRAWGARADAAFWYWICWAEGVVRD